MGFPSTVPQCTLDDCRTREADGSMAITRIIPDMNFTCSGTVTGWRAAGEIRTAGSAEINSVLSIWRERSNEPGTYDRTDGIELGRCGSEDPAPSVMGMSNVYECSLPQSETVSVQPGDVVGVELPGRTRVRFRLYFDNSGRSTNYIFSQSLQTFNLDQNDGTELAQPQISLTVESTVEAVQTTPFLATAIPATVVYCDVMHFNVMYVRVFRMLCAYLCVCTWVLKTVDVLLLSGSLTCASLHFCYLLGYHIWRRVRDGDSGHRAGAGVQPRDGLSNGIRGASEALHPSERDRGCS